MNRVPWMSGTLRERLGPLKPGQIVFFRRVARQLAAGPCWWIRPQGIDHYWMVAESFGGENLKDLIRVKRHSKGELRGQPLLSPDEITDGLVQGLIKFVRSRPPGSIPLNPGATHDKSRIRTQVRL